MSEKNPFSPPIADVSVDEITEIEPGIWSRWPFWVLAFFFVGSLLGVLQPMSLGQKPDYLAPFAVLFWTPVLTAYIFKNKKRNIWLGIAVGIGLGFFICISIQMVFSALWATGHIQPPP
jgi:hypothetical protein